MRAREIACGGPPPPRRRETFGPVRNGSEGRCSTIYDGSILSELTVGWENITSCRSKRVIGRRSPPAWRPTLTKPPGVLAWPAGGSGAVAQPATTITPAPRIQSACSTDQREREFFIRSLVRISPRGSMLQELRIYSQLRVLSLPHSNRPWEVQGDRLLIHVLRGLPMGERTGSTDAIEGKVPRSLSVGNSAPESRP